MHKKKIYELSTVSSQYANAEGPLPNVQSRCTVIRWKQPFWGPNTDEKTVNGDFNSSESTVVQIRQYRFHLPVHRTSKISCLHFHKRRANSRSHGDTDTAQKQRKQNNDCGCSWTKNRRKISWSWDVVKGFISAFPLYMCQTLSLLCTFTLRGL